MLLLVGLTRSGFQTPVTSGLPQGSIPGPLFFVLYNNGLPNVVVHRNTALFAVDAKLFLRSPQKAIVKRYKRSILCVSDLYYV